MKFRTLAVHIVLGVLSLPFGAPHLCIVRASTRWKQNYLHATFEAAATKKRAMLYRSSEFYYYVPDSGGFLCVILLAACFVVVVGVVVVIGAQRQNFSN